MWKNENKNKGEREVKQVDGGDLMLSDKIDLYTGPGDHLIQPYLVRGKFKQLKVPYGYWYRRPVTGVTHSQVKPKILRKATRGEILAKHLLQECLNEFELLKLL
jgi:hypothetical protein